MATPHRNNIAYLSESSSGRKPAMKQVSLSEEEFQRMLAIERKRTERSHEPFLLVLIDGVDWPNIGAKEMALDRVLRGVLRAVRETDVVGWYVDRSTVGAIFTGLPVNHKGRTLDKVLERVRWALSEELSPDQLAHIRLSSHIFPDEWESDDSGDKSNPTLYPDIHSRAKEKKVMLAVKRAIDVVGSLSLLIVFAPLFAAIAIAIKVSSSGPVFFKQKRIGQHGRLFTFLKFRSMHVGNDQSVHQQYVEQLIAGSAQRVVLQEGCEGVYKLAHDQRITPIGRILRRTSIDELPQFLNVLRGDMSLVGPRPPIPYELTAYETWHRSRLLQVKPGITGLWQVTGRSRVTFDEMVRMDLQYATTWSPWLDIWILLRTPAAVIKGAY